MKVRKISKTTVRILSKESGISENFLQKKCKRALKEDGILYLKKGGYYSVTRPGKSYNLVKIQSGYTEAEVENRFSELLEKLSGKVCKKCSELIRSIIDA